MAKAEKLTALFTTYQQRHDGDCAVASLAMALDLPYEAVLIVASRIASKVLSRGLYSVEIQLIAEDFGCQLEKKTKVDLDTDTGVLIVQFKDKNEHAVFLINRLVFEPTGKGEVWDVDDYLKANKARVLHLLEEQ